MVVRRRIAQISRTARETADTRRAALLMEYRRHYELLEAEADYQRFGAETNEQLMIRAAQEGFVP